MFWVWQNSGHKLWIFRFRKMYTCKVNVKYTCAIWVCSIRAVQRRVQPCGTVIPRRTPVSCYLIARHGRFSTTRTIKPYMTEQRRTLVNFKNKVNLEEFEIMSICTWSTYSSGLSEARAVAEESSRAEPTGQHILGPQCITPGSRRTGVLTRVSGACWTVITHGAYVTISGANL